MWVHSQEVYVFAFYLLQQAIKAITTTTATIISNAGFIIIKAMMKNNTINPMNFPIAISPE